MTPSPNTPTMAFILLRVRVTLVGVRVRGQVAVSVPGLSRGRSRDTVQVDTGSRGFGPRTKLGWDVSLN